MSISLLTVVTAITGLMYSFARIQREYFSPEVLDALLAIALVSTAMLLSALVNLVSTRSFERSKKRAPSHVLRLIISTTVYAVFAILILKFVYAKDITALLAATAALTVGLAWGLREPIAHLFSGLVLEIERPWAVGDYVRFKDQSGRVEALKWRNVHVRTVYDTLLVLPNSEIANSLVEVFPANRTCLHFVDVGIQDDVSPSRVLKAATEVVSTGLAFVDYSADRPIQITKMDPMSGTINYRIHFGARDLFQADAVKTVIVERLWHALARDGIHLRGVNQSTRFRHLSAEPLDDGAKQAAGAERRSAFLRTIDVFRHLDSEAVGLLGRQFDLVTYGPGERVRAHQQRPDSLFLVLRGRLHVRFHSDDQRRPDSDIGTDAASVASHPDASHWNRHALQQASEDLTFVLGPVAPRLVEREARCTSDLFELYHRLGRHIDDDDERRSFLERGPDAHVRELTAGDGFSGAAGDEGRLLEALVVAAQEAELMELTGERKRAAMAEHGPLADALAALAERARKLGIR
jgi:small-conductance mechanosensitive channel